MLHYILLYYIVLYAQIYHGFVFSEKTIIQIYLLTIVLRVLKYLL